MLFSFHKDVNCTGNLNIRHPTFITCILALTEKLPVCQQSARVIQNHDKQEFKSPLVHPVCISQDYDLNSAFPHVIHTLWNLSASLGTLFLSLSCSGSYKACTNSVRPGAVGIIMAQRSTRPDGTGHQVTHLLLCLLGRCSIHCLPRLVSSFPSPPTLFRPLHPKECQKATVTALKVQGLQLFLALEASTHVTASLYLPVQPQYLSLFLNVSLCHTLTQAQARRNGNKAED